MTTPDCCDDYAQLVAAYRRTHRHLQDLRPAYDAAREALTAADRACLAHRCDHGGEQ